jgi:hypothetical protein
VGGLGGFVGVRGISGRLRCSGKSRGNSWKQTSSGRFRGGSGRRRGGGTIFEQKELGHTFLTFST